MPTVGKRHATRGGRSNAASSHSREGRPTDFKPEFIEQAYKLALLGAVDRELAEFFDVSEKTLNTWKTKHPEFLQSIKRGKAAADSNVANSLYHRALGYEHKAVKIMQHEGVAFEHEYTEHYAPDTAACIFFLKNRRPDLWRDKQQLEHTAGNAAGVEDMSADDIRKELARRGALAGAGKG